MEIIITDEWLDYIAEDFLKDNKGMNFIQYIEFRKWQMENEHKINPHKD